MDYLGAKKKCDLVMQGGVTSGIVYPGAACKLAEAYRFVNIGGTSAGAIAAAATAAAEYRRSSGDSKGFEELAMLPGVLGAPVRNGTKLFSLFQPEPYAEKLFALAVAPLGKTAIPAILAIVWASIKLWWYFWSASIAAGAAIGFLASHGHSIGLSIFFGLLVFVLVLAILILASVVLSIFKLPKHGFGLCSGMGTDLKQPALTQWLTDYLHNLSGKQSKNEPLTFGDLREHDVTLRMISTCYTHGRPYGLPLDTNQFFFKEAEFQNYFPKEVVEWMVRHQGPNSEPRDNDPVDTSGFCRWPSAADLPVVVASRMSLSFPVLFSAVPLYAIDFSLRRATVGEPAPAPQPGGALRSDQPRTPERCWFIDGGICSNFPMYLFDAPIPRWPTFGIDLEPERKDRPGAKVWMPSTNSEGFAEQFTRIETTFGSGIVTWLLGIVDAARNWMDNRQITVPGYRDRVVHVRLDDKSEGGLQLNMPPEVVAAVGARGGEAAELLLSHFDTPEPDDPVTWENHRWVRLRSMLSLLEEMVLDIKKGFDETEPGDQSYDELLARPHNAPPMSYKLTAAQRTFIIDWLAKFEPLTGILNDQFSKGAPRPLPVLRVLPRTASADDADVRDAKPHDPLADAKQAIAPPKN